MSEPIQVHEHHHPGPKTYAIILGALLFLTIVTVGAAYLDFGSMNTVIALLIASLKGSLVALFFMHLKNDRFNALIFVGGLFFLGVFLIFTLFDISHRTPLYPGNLKAPIAEFPGAQIGKPFQPSDGRQYPFNEPPPAPKASPAAPAAPGASHAPAQAAH